MAYHPLCLRLAEFLHAPRNLSRELTIRRNLEPAILLGQRVRLVHVVAFLHALCPGDRGHVVTFLAAEFFQKIYDDVILRLCFPRRSS